MPLVKSKGGIFYGWWVLLACAVIQFYLGGVFFNGFTALFNPLVDEFGWSYALVSLAFSFFGVEIGILSPGIGFLVDRLGPRRLLLTSTIIVGLSFVLLSRIQALWSFYALILFLSLGFSFGSAVVSMAAVAKWFKTRTSLAMGILMTGFGAGGFLTPGVVWVIDQFGWRNAVVVFGAGAWLLGIPLSLVVKEPPGEAYAVSPEAGSSHVEQNPEGVKIKELLKKKDFWLLSLAILFGWIAGAAIVVHQIPYLVSIGISRQVAGLMVLVRSLSDVLGRLAFGWLGDILNKKRCFAIAALLKAGGVLAFALSGTTWQFVPILIIFGIGFGGLVPLRPALQIELFGTKAFATIQGLLFISVTVGNIVSPFLAGWVFDLFGSYRLAFILLAAFTLLAIPMVLAISKKPDSQTQ